MAEAVAKNVTTIYEMAEQYAPWFPGIGRKRIEDFASAVLRCSEIHFSRAAGHGVEQARRLMCDPAYYENRRARFKKRRDERELQKQRQDQERLEKTLCPTAEQVEEQRWLLTSWIANYEAQITAWKKTLDSLPANPKHVRMPQRPTSGTGANRPRGA